MSSLPLWCGLIATECPTNLYELDMELQKYVLKQCIVINIPFPELDLQSVKCPAESDGITDVVCNTILSHLPYVGSGIMSTANN